MDIDQLTIDDAFFFGCSEVSGHFLHKAREGGGRPRCVWEGSPWTIGEIDGGMQPNVVKEHGTYALRTEIEGESLLRHREGWTALCMWDRSLDPRGGSNANFIFRGVWDFEQMCELAKRFFPTIWGRFTFEVKLQAQD